MDEESLDSSSEHSHRGGELRMDSSMEFPSSGKTASPGRGNSAEYGLPVMGTMLNMTVPPMNTYPRYTMDVARRRYSGPLDSMGMPYPSMHYHHSQYFRRSFPPIPRAFKPSPKPEATTESPKPADDNASTDNRSHTSSRKKTARESFPSKLHRLLSSHEYDEYISWLPHGRAFKVHKTSDFAIDVLPRFFKSARYASFMRQVNGWGFRRINDGPDQSSYYHELFLRGYPDLTDTMTRASLTREEASQPAPDFYKISMVAPLPDEDSPPSTPPITTSSINGLQLISKVSADFTGGNDSKMSVSSRQHSPSSLESSLSNSRSPPRRSPRRKSPSLSPPLDAVMSSNPGSEAALGMEVSLTPGRALANRLFNTSEPNSVTNSARNSPSLFLEGSSQGSLAEYEGITLLPSFGDTTLMPTPLRRDFRSPGSHHSDPFMPLPVSFLDSTSMDDGEACGLSKVDMAYLAQYNQIMQHRNKTARHGVLPS